MCQKYRISVSFQAFLILFIKLIVLFNANASFFINLSIISSYMHLNLQLLNNIQLLNHDNIFSIIEIMTEPKYIIIIIL